LRRTTIPRQGGAPFRDVGTIFLKAQKRGPEPGQAAASRRVEDYDRQDLLLPTSNKQLNFLQHIMTVPALDPSARLRGACNRGDPAR
jgi:hypothetical protein